MPLTLYILIRLILCHQEPPFHTHKKVQKKPRFYFHARYHSGRSCSMQLLPVRLRPTNRDSSKREPFKPLQFIQIAPDVIFKGMEWLLASLMLGSLSSKIGIEKWRHLDSPSPGFGWGCCHLYTGGMVPPNLLSC